MFNFKRAIWALGIFLFLSPLVASANSNVYEFTSDYRTADRIFSGLIIEYDLRSSADDIVQFQVRFKDGRQDTEWVDIETGIPDDGNFARMDALVNTNPTKQFQYRIKTVAGPDNIKPSITNLRFRAIHAQGDTTNVVASSSTTASLMANSAGSGLRIISRSGWGARDELNYRTVPINGSIQSGDRSAVINNDPEIERVITTENGHELRWPMQYMRDVRMIVVHHTASTANLNDPRQAIRNIQHYHAVTRGWGDIGYNFIIDQQGNIYEGRKGGPRVVGGHALPVNKTSIGISVLGNFETQRVPRPVVDAIVNLAGHQARLYGLDVTRNVSYKNQTYPVLGGHRDNSRTACPGRNLYALLPLIRTLIDTGQNFEPDERALGQQDFAYIDLDPLRDLVELRPGQGTKVEVRVRNVGRQSWNRTNTFLRALNQNEFRNGLSIQGASSDRIASLRENSVAPGATGTFEFEVSALQSSGFYSIMAQAVLNGQSRHSLPIFIPFNVANPSASPQRPAIAGFNYEVVGGSNMNLELERGERRTIQVTFRNTGTRTWNENFQFLRLGLHTPRDGNSRLFEGGNRVAMFGLNEIPPGSTHRLTLNLRAPNQDVTITERFAPVIDGLMWFEDGNPLTITAKVGRGSLENLRNDEQTVTLLKSNNVRQVEYKFVNNSRQTLTRSNTTVRVIGGAVLNASNASLVETRIEPGDQGTIRLNVTPNIDTTRVLQLRVLHNGQAVFNDMFKLNLVIGDGGTQNNVAEQPTNPQNNQDVNLQSEEVLGPNIRINISTFQLNEAEVSNTTNASLLVDGRSVANLNANQRFKVERSGNQVRTTINGSTFTGNNIVLQPSGLNGINTIHNYENRPAWNTSLNDNEFRGALEFRIIDNGLRVINELPLEHYMRGVAEISNNAETEKIKTIMVAARSYAYFHIVEAPDRKFPGKGYNLDDSPDRTQKYIGYGFEKRSPNVTRAIQDTAGKVITYNGELIIIPYFNNSDGRTRSAQEVWGWTNTPYLQSVEDKYCPTPNQLLGHGVGISGCGSTGMARAGYSHEDIIRYYLQGVDFRIAYSASDNSMSNVADFPDVNAQNPFRDAIRFVRSRGIVEGYPDGTFKPDARINRAEFTKIVMEAKFDSIPEQSSCFSDVPNGQWFTKYVCLAKQEGIIEGYPDGTFKPAQNINIAEALKIVLETFYTEIPNVQGEWFMKYRRFAESSNLFLADRWTGMANMLTRGEMAELIFRILR